jgi:uncharacterized protein (DUF1778 family)
VPAIPYIAKTILTPQDAIASHVRWKITLLLAATIREPLTNRATLSIQCPEECSIYKWLLSKHTLHLRGTPEYRTVLDLHAAFHGQMLRIANLINAGDFAEAEHILNAPQPFQSASTSLANAIMALDRCSVPASQRKQLFFRPQQPRERAE